MKAKPFKFIPSVGYQPCVAEEATHVKLSMPGPSGVLVLPVQLRGRREGTGNWTWNGDTEKPTLMPSVRTQGGNFTCHTWINDGQAQFLPDSTHELAGQTVDLIDVEKAAF